MNTVRQLLQNKGHEVLSIEPHNSVYNAMQLMATRPSKESAVKSFLESRLELVNQEATTPVWFVLQLESSTHTKPSMVMLSNIA